MCHMKYLKKKFIYKQREQQFSLPLVEGGKKIYKSIKICEILHESWQL